MGDLGVMEHEKHHKIHQQAGLSAWFTLTRAWKKPFRGSSELPGSQAGKSARAGLQQVCENDLGPVPMLGIEAVLINGIKLNITPP